MPRKRDQWWRELNLPARALIGRDGRFSRDTPEWITTEAGVAAYEELKGKTEEWVAEQKAKRQVNSAAEELGV